MQLKEIAWTELATPEMILDTGCRCTVVGQDWHQMFQSHLKAYGLRGVRRETSDTFRYGNGETVQGTCSWVYHVSIHGNQGMLDVAEVPVGTPHLASRMLMEESGYSV